MDNTQRYVDSSFLEIEVVPEYLTIARIINDLKPKGEAYWIPSFPKDGYLPEYLKGLKEMVIFISSDRVSGMASMGELAKGKFKSCPVLRKMNFLLTFSDISLWLVFTAIILLTSELDGALEITK